MESKRIITPHKGGRTENINVRVRPEIKQKFNELCKEVSQADWIEDAVIEAYEKVKRVN